MLAVRPPNPTMRRRLLLLAAASAVLSLPSCTSVAGLFNGVVNTGIKVGLAKLLLSCVPEGVEVDTPSGPVAIEQVRAGDLVIGFGGEPVRVLQAHEYAEDAGRERFYRVRFESGATVTVCDLHRIGGQRARTLAPGKEVAGERVESVEIFGGVERSYDLLTEDAGYRIDGVPVNSMIEEMAELAAEL